MTVKKIIAAAIAVVILAGGAGFGFMRWHNQKMKEMQEKCDREIELAKEEEERRIEVEKSLDEMAKKNKELADAVEIARANRDSWQAKCKKLELRIEDLLEIVHIETLDSVEIKHAIQKINEYIVLAYNYRNTAMIENHETFQISILNGTKVPFSEKVCVISMDGTIKIGIDVNKVDVECNDRSKTITVSLPKSKVLSNELHEDTLYVYTEKDSIFNRLNATDHSKLRSKIKEDSERLAQENGALDQADERAQHLIQTMLEQIPNVKANYTIEFKTIE